MNRFKLTLRKHGWEAALLAAMLAVTAYLLLRNFGLNPVIFADEWYYSKFSRLAPLSEAIVPSYLYLWIFRSTNACGIHFADCARGLNALFFVAAAPFIYLVARRVAGRPLAMFIAVMGMLAPLNLFTAFFMPESMYYFGFAVLSWIAINHSGWPTVRYALATGALLGLMSLIKVHALFLLPALCLFAVLARWDQAPPNGRLRDGLLAVALIALATFGVRLGLGYLLAGAPALQLFGGFYASSANSTVNRSLFTLLEPALVNGGGHLMAMAVLYALPLALLFHRLPLRLSQLSADGPLGHLRLWLLLLMGTALAMTIAYTASLAAPGSIEGVRLHMRYYSFAFPLLLALGAAPLRNGLERVRPAFGLAIALLLGAVMLAALLKLRTYTLSMIDGPDIAAFHQRNWLLSVLVVFNLVLLRLWVARKKLALQLYLFVAVPAALFTGAVASTVLLAQLINPWPADKAGAFAHRFVPKAEHKSITVAGTDLGQLMRALFHIDDKDTSLLDLPDPHEPIEHYQLPPKNKWLLVIGDHALPSGVKPLIKTPDFALVRFDTVGRILGTSDLVRPIGDALIERIDGLSHSEPLGRWSTGKQVVITFRHPLPKQFSFAFKAQAFGPNANADFILHAGALALPFRLSEVPQAIGLHVESDGTLRTLTIEVPHPVRPMDLGPSIDDRAIGLAISEISIGEIKAAAPLALAPH